MPKEKQSEKIIPKLYRRKFEDLAMFFYVKGQRDIMPAVSIEKSLYNFYKSIGEEDFNIESGRMIFQRMQREYYESAKTNK